MRRQEEVCRRVQAYLEIEGGFEVAYLLIHDPNQTNTEGTNNYNNQHKNRNKNKNFHAGVTALTQHIKGKASEHFPMS